MEARALTLSYIHNPLVNVEIGAQEVPQVELELVILLPPPPRVLVLLA